MQNADIIDNIYTIINYLDKGGISKIYLVRNVNNNIEYVARIRRKNLNGYPHELQMTTIVSNLNNPNIIHLDNNGTGIMRRLGHIHNNINYFILNYYPHGDLLKYVEIGGRFLEKRAKLIFKKILNGVRDLHNAGICHRNLKLNNILLDQNYNPKISNFASSGFFMVNNAIIPLNEPIGRIISMPPQMILHLPYNGAKADIFSLGVLLFNLVTNKFPFKKAHISDLYYKFIIKKSYSSFWNILSSFGINYLSQEFKSLFLKMVSFDENERPSIEQILVDNWFNELKTLNDAQLVLLENEVRNDFITRDAHIHNIPNGALPEYDPNDPDDYH